MNYRENLPFDLPNAIVGERIELKEARLNHRNFLTGLKGKYGGAPAHEFVGCSNWKRQAVKLVLKTTVTSGILLLGTAKPSANTITNYEFLFHNWRSHFVPYQFFSRVSPVTGNAISRGHGARSFSQA
jgi:hypothetical protein